MALLCSHVGADSTPKQQLLRSRQPQAGGAWAPRLSNKCEGHCNLEIIKCGRQRCSCSPSCVSTAYLGTLSQLVYKAGAVSYIDVVLTTSKTGSMRVAKSFFSNPEQILSNIIIISSRPCGQIQKLQYLAQQLRKKSGLNVSTQITQRRQESSLLSPSLSNEGTNCSRAPQML